MADLSEVDSIQNKIYTIRGKHVMLDSDLAEIYQVETRVLNQAVKRNSDRFPEDFMFQLTQTEWGNLKSQNEISSLTSQNVILENNRGKHRKYLPYVFTEQGVAGLSGILKSETAAMIHVAIMRAFVSMRKFLLENASVFQRLERVELKQLETGKQIEHILKAIESKNATPVQGVFYDGQVFDAYVFVIDLIKTAKSSIILIDNYVDDTVLQMFSKRKKNVLLKIYTNSISNALELDIKKFNAQYPPVEIRKFNKSHDRFLIIDNKTIYHFGASLKDLGKKWFAFSKMDTTAIEMINKLNK